MDCIKCNKKLVLIIPYTFKIKCDECDILYELDFYESYIDKIIYKNKIKIESHYGNELLHNNSVIYLINEFDILDTKKFNSYEEILEYLTNLYDNLIFE